jgi:hypothetical protein
LLFCVASVRTAAEFRTQHRNDLDCWNETEPRTVGIRRIETVMRVVIVSVNVAHETEVCRLVRLKRDGTRAETRFSSFAETDESI